ncbi:iron export ABC transporter permease subunit FetB [Kyrpidia spormannii]|uniref:Iron export ABC transporter permease subunit FetB n=1 Tax=Kyrpidia spormannii TaxID=2055160 RepID=A0A2K8N950_9BACL|nr:iron export ABC transporter permease subunit FetB [Kyrpidia spormannii]ATY85859.1 iron export ABC transporter permease subunit FetB [Kyrpidia spormannii]
MSLLALSFTLGFVVLALILSLWQRLGMEKDMIVSTVRATVQLLIVGYILKVVFSIQGPALILAMILLMLVVATFNAAKRGRGMPGIHLRILFALTLTEAVTQAFLLLMRIVPPTPQYVIPISGMIIGNAMVVAGLFLNRLRAEAENRKEEINLILSLGGTPRQAIQPVLKTAVRAGMIPTIDSTKTTGLVQLPGMMTGQIIAGADPIQAVRYQLLILFAILASAALTSMVLGFLTYPRLFNTYQQLVLPAQNSAKLGS